MTYREYLRFRKGTNPDTDELIRLIRANMSGIVTALARDGAPDFHEILRAAAVNRPEEFIEAMDRVTLFALDGVDVIGLSEPEDRIGEQIAQIMLHNIKLFEEISGLKEVDDA